MMISLEKPPLQELTHHGVMGMKWGHRKSEEASSRVTNKRETKGQKFDTLAANAKTDKKRQIYEREAERARAGKLSRRQRQVIVGATVVAAYAAFKLVDSGEAGRLITRGKDYVNGNDQSSPWKKNELFGRKDLDANTAFNEVALNINKQYGAKGTTQNCRRCTFAYIKAREGFDVEATRTLKATGQSNIGLYNAVSGKKKIKGGKIGAIWQAGVKQNKEVIDFFSGYNNKDINSRVFIGTDPTKYAENIFSSLSKHPPNARGELTMEWNVGGGHSMAWEIFNGKPAIFDCQTRIMYDTPEKLQELAGLAKTFRSSRLDNVKIDPTILERWIK